MTKTEQRVLDYVNRLRDKIELKPLKQLPVGQPSNTQRCVLANALSTKAKQGFVFGGGNDVEVYAVKDCVSGTNWIRPRHDRKALLEVPKVPKYVSKFISSFDDERYKHLVAA